MATWHFEKPPVPGSAIAMSLGALAVPVAGSLWFAESASEYELLLWLLAFVPAFLLAYYRGWRGAAAALGAAMLAYAAAQVVKLAWGHELQWPLPLVFAAAYLGGTLGVAVLSERLHASRARAELLALTDELTELPNRRHARLYLERQLKAFGGEPLSIIMFDIDHFKEYNDRYGHVAGDAALCVVAGVLQRIRLSRTMTARYGGEEFLSILPSADPGAALGFVEQVQDALVRAEEVAEPITVCAGLAEFSAGMSYSELLEAADRALYQAKQRGRSCVEMFQPLAV
ncbi:MAG: GGDEF domain-containing protein [Longimicrobiales bacterium]